MSKSHILLHSSIKDIYLDSVTSSAVSKWGQTVVMQPLVWVRLKGDWAQKKGRLIAAFVSSRFAPTHKKWRSSHPFLGGWFLKMRKPDGRKTLPDPNSLVRYSGSAFIFQCRVKEKKVRMGVEWGKAGKHSDTDIQAVTNSETVQNSDRDVMPEVRGMFQFSLEVLFCLFLFSLFFYAIPVSKLCFLCLYFFLTFSSPSHTSDPVSHILDYSTFTWGAGAKKTMHVKGER